MFTTPPVDDVIRNILPKYNEDDQDIDEEEYAIDILKGLAAVDFKAGDVPADAKPANTGENSGTEAAPEPEGTPATDAPATQDDGGAAGDGSAEAPAEEPAAEGATQ